MTQQRRKRIGLMTNTLLSSYQIALRDALERCACARGCELLVLVGRELEHPDVNEETQNVIFDWLATESVDGLIALTGVLVNYAGAPAVMRILERVAPVPVVSVGVELPRVPSVTVDNRAGMRELVDHLLRVHGCRRIGYISGPPDNQEADARLHGYRDALEACGIEPAPELVVHGRFTLPTGAECMNELLARGLQMDAAVAANDYMALAAMDTLRERGIAVPRQIRVAGFDDSPLAHLASRPLTSVAQPVDVMAARALELLLASIDHTELPLVTALAPRLVLRDSCGCTGLELRSSPAPRTSAESASAFVLRSRKALVSSLSELGPGPSASWWQERSAELVQALGRELAGQTGAFAYAVEDMLDAAANARVPLDSVRRSVLLLERSLDGAGVGDVADLERLWLLTLNMISEASGRAEGRSTLDLLERFIDLRHAAQRLSVALDPETIAAELSQALPRLGVRHACVALLDPNDPKRLVPILLLQDRIASAFAGAPYPRAELVPERLLGAHRSFLIMPLSFEADVYGLFAVDGDSSPRVCELLRTHIGTAIKLGALQRRVIEETAARERADQLTLEGEIAIARQIQTALAPKQHRVPHLAISAAMVPAKDVGGDYYDVIAVPGGAWLCIADVTGHGLLSGLVMLMIQSMVTALARARPNAKPAELLSEVNQGLTPNVRERLGKNEHATMVAVRFFEDGSLEFAGSHEDLIIYRRASGRAELVPTLGVWIGIMEDIRECTPEQSARLEPGDMLVLYTDGFVEARSVHGTQFGRDRLCQLVETHAPSGPDALKAEMLQAVAAWSALPEDDLTCLIARYEPR